MKKVVGVYLEQEERALIDKLVKGLGFKGTSELMSYFLKVYSPKYIGAIEKVQKIQREVKNG